MNIQRVAAGIVVLVAALAAPLTAQDKVLLARSAKVGDVTRTKLTATLAGNLGGQPASLAMTGVDTVTVTAIGADGQLTFRQLTESIDLSVNGSAMPGLPIPPADTLMMMRTRALTSYTSGDGDAEAAAFEARMYIATTAVFSDKPVGVGDTWTRSVAADPKVGAVQAKAEFKVLAFEKVGGADTVKISMSFQESGADGIQTTGTFWIDRATGEDVKSEVEFKDAPFPQIGPVSGSIAQERVRAS